MKQLLILVIATVAFMGNSFAQEGKKAHVNWIQLEQAQKLAKKDKKLIIIDMYTPWCGPCKAMERSTFTDADLVSFLEKNFHAVKFNAEGPDPVTYNGNEYTNPGYDASRGNGRNSMHSLTRKFGVRGYPTLVILDSNGEIVTSLVGYRKAIDVLTNLQKLK